MNYQEAIDKGYKVLGNKGYYIIEEANENENR